MGETTACILGEQFTRLRTGDRFFFTHERGGSKNEQGLEESLREVIRKRLLSDIMCDNIPTLEEVSQNVFDYNSPKIGCNDDGRTILNLSEFLEKFPFAISNSTTEVTPPPVDVKGMVFSSKTTSTNVSWAPP